ncbi:MAG: hypothetical protein RR585_00020 [Coprobacillus sp.]
MEKSKKVVIATHGKLAEGFVSALEIIVGDMSHVEVICGYTTPDFNLDESILNIVKNHDFKTQELIVCTDMMGGSINNGFVRYLSQYPFHLITNINLAFLVDLLLTSEAMSKEVLTSKVDEEMVSVKYINNLVDSFNDSDDL